MDYRTVFQRFVPPPAVEYCVKLYDYFGFEFKIKKARQTKLGDYRYDPASKKHTITVNNDLNAFAFLITYLHEVAHLATFKEHGRKVAPHGEEWKAMFKRVARPILNDEVFPPNILLSLKNYLANAKASSCSDPILFQVLKQYDDDNGKVLLKKLKAGDRFEFNDKRFVYLSKRRTRILCQDVETRRQYLINQIAEVVLLDEST